MSIPSPAFLTAQTDEGFYDVIVEFHCLIVNRVTILDSDR